MRLSLRKAARARRAGIPARQGVRQQRAVQSDLLHGRQPGAVSPVPRKGGHAAPGHSRQLRLLHRRLLRPVPLRHVRGRVSLRAEERRLRRLPRAAVPGQRRDQGRVRRAGPEVHGRFRLRHAQRAAPGRRVQRSDLPDSPVRSEQGRNRSRVPRDGRRAVRRLFANRKSFEIDAARAGLGQAEISRATRSLRNTFNTFGKMHEHL